MQSGIHRAEAILAQRAAAEGAKVGEYKKGLRRQYRDMLAAVRRARPESEQQE
jgi:hypothetical protein